MRLTDTEIVRDGYEMLDAAMAEYREGRSVGLDTASQLAALLTRQRYRDHAWTVMAHDPQAAPQYIVMWQEIGHASVYGQVAAPAMLLAYATWQEGDTSGAAEALNWALTEQPEYHAALCIAAGIGQGMAPGVMTAALPGTRAVRLSYDDALRVLAHAN